MDSLFPSKKTLSFEALLEMSCFSYFLILVYGFKIFFEFFICRSMHFVLICAVCNFITQQMLD